MVLGKLFRSSALGHTLHGHRGGRWVDQKNGALEKGDHDWSGADSVATECWFCRGVCVVGKALCFDPA